MPNDEKVKALLADLGKSTLRGVKKCPKCGTYNGTRGLSCKNKACDVVFKEAGEKRKQSTEVCKLITGNNTQVEYDLFIACSFIFALMSSITSFLKGSSSVYWGFFSI